MSENFDSIPIPSLPLFDENQRLYLIETKRRKGIEGVETALVKELKIEPKTADFISHHLNIDTDSCHNCGSSIYGEHTTCSHCNSFNLNWTSIRELKKKTAFYVGSRTEALHFSILTPANFVRLGVGNYEVWLIGGISGQINDFMIHLTNIETGELLKIRRNNRLIPKYPDNNSMRPAMVPFVFDVEEFGVFKITFQNSQSLHIRRHHALSIFSWFCGEVPIQQITTQVLRVSG